MTALYNKGNTYYQLSGNSYNNKKVNGKKLKIDATNSGEQEFKVQTSRVDKGNGFQAIAVSPIEEDGKVDNDTVYFAYVGTNFLFYRKYRFYAMYFNKSCA